MSPPPALQKLLFAVLAPLGRALGYKASYPRHKERNLGAVEVEPLPEGIAVNTEP